MGANAPAAQSAYPGAGSYYSPPVLAEHRQIKSWGAQGICLQQSGQLTDILGTFITDGLQAGDPIAVVASQPTELFLTTIFRVEQEGELLINYFTQNTLINCWYKAGAGAVHTLQTLASQLKLTIPGPEFFRWGWLWSSALPENFNPDETGLLLTI